MAGGRILVIDDVGMNRILIREILKSVGYNVDEADGPMNALRQLSCQRYDLVICDLMMPTMDGLTLFNKIKTRAFGTPNEQVSPPPFILCSAFLDKTKSELALKSGFRDVISKPVVAEDLIRIVKTILENQSERTFVVTVSCETADYLYQLADLSHVEPEQLVSEVLSELQSLNLERWISMGLTAKQSLRRRLGYSERMTSAQDGNPENQ